MLIRHREWHRTEHVGWLRAAVLGANDGILSTASLVLGVAAAHGTRNGVLVAGVAGLVAGAMAMAAGEYVSVHSQADTEKADLAREHSELRANDEGERKELTEIYVGRGLDPSLAKQVADQLKKFHSIVKPLPPIYLLLFHIFVLERLDGHEEHEKYSTSNVELILDYE
jgi:vacuolar iron transporter family protein